MEKVIITAAVTGSRPTKEMNHAVPYTPQDIAQSAIECYRAGAAIAHIHVRDPQSGEPAFKIEMFREVMDRIRDQCDMLLNLTTSGLHLSGPDLIEKRLQPLTLRPEICSFDVGSVNFPDLVFVNPPEWGRAATQRMRGYGVKPEGDTFDAGLILGRLAGLSLRESGLLANALGALATTVVGAGISLPDPKAALSFLEERQNERPWTGWSEELVTVSEFLAKRSTA